ncbi:hypothetical protein GL325_10780 [Aeromicrobium sp. 636]|uniref:Uncharacterized protein n=1 Tax=Aeromicrobium senzhongii TaxID=2663859 RepID=A0A8I0EWW2_9ACTN|nr:MULTISPECIES: hypothetical protein [Aeromicrobium]MBC9226812.1 hypothetical protein [Aeromicrobium senzhongii]MCQ3998912.1 hypothetical protein [Aeromicrobium sp. 636]
MASGVRFPTDSSTATARHVVADALRKVDPVGARSVEQETNWRRGYLTHFSRLVEAGLGAPQDAVTIASEGLRSMNEQMLCGDLPLAEAVSAPPTEAPWSTVEIQGDAEPETELSIPYRGRRLTGAELDAQLDDWVRRGVVEPTFCDAIREVAAHPEWLRLEGDTVVVLGAGAEMGPYRSLLRWGADVVAVDLPRADVQQRIRSYAREGAGRVRLPVGGKETGADLLHNLPELAHWLESLDGRLVLGTYCYADGATHVRVSMAADAIATRLLAERPDTALAYLATPTDVFAVPAGAVTTSNEAYSAGRRIVRAPFRALSGGRLLQRNYPPEAEIGLCDSLVPQQGPNYALAKRVQRWRAAVARAEGATVSLNVAPATRTASVLKNRALAAAYAGAHRFGVEIFEPATSNVLMAALLVHDLRSDRTPSDEPWREEAFAAAHGGLWTAGYHPRSALGLAAVLGLAGSRA